MSKTKATKTADRATDIYSVGIMLASLKDRRALLMENLLLRQQLAVALRAPRRPTRSA